MTIAHHDFTIARTYPHPPAAVFEAFRDPAKKHLWFGAHEGFVVDSLEFDFRVGGRERASTDHGDGITSTFDATYADIVPGERIVFSYNMTLNGAPLSASATAVTFEAVEGGTLLTHTEHGIHLDGLPGAHGREEGTSEILKDLGRALDAIAAS